MFFDLMKFKNKIAFVTEDRKIFYQDLAQSSNQIGNAVSRRCLVFLFATNSVESISAYIGFINNKIVPVMIDSELDTDFARNLISIYRPEFLFLPKTLQENFSGAKIFSFGSYVLLATEEKKPFALNEELALLMTTSGSTGSPKFVRQTYKNILSNTKSIIDYLQIDSAERAITNLPMHYVYGLSIINTHIFCGASIVVTEKTLFDKNFWQLMKDFEVTNLNGVPYTFEMLKRLRFFKMYLPALKKITQAGGKLDSELHLKFAEFAAQNDKKFFVMYGASEATARMAYLPPEKSLQKIGSMGIAIPSGRFELADDEGNLISKNDEVGELIYYGENVSLGYAERGEDLSKGDERHGRLETGDLAKVDGEGFYTVVGRKKRFLKIFGKRVNLQEVEHIIRQKFNVEVAAAGIDDKMKIFVTDENFVEKISPYLSEKLNLHPSAFEVKFINNIPKNSSGKIIYKDLEKF